MTSPMTDDAAVLNALLSALNKGQVVWLCMITEAIGSSPRPVGTLLAVDAEGQQTGSLSGGCVEEDLVSRLVSGEFDSHRIQFIEYGVSAENNERLGLPCGGRLHVAIQQLNTVDLSWIKAAQQAISERYILQRRLSIPDGDSATLLPAVFQPLTRTDTSLLHCFGPRMRLLLVGAGAIAASVAQLAIAMDYEVILTDSREWAIAQWTGPEVECVLGFPDDIIQARGADQHCAIITLSHDPRVDDMALLEALETRAWYVGALGSLRTTRKRIARLQALGITELQLSRLKAPVGLSIGSKAPMEIAVSIMAELTQCRHTAE